MANTKVTGDLIASGTIHAANLVSGTLDTLFEGYLTNNAYATQGYVQSALGSTVAAASDYSDFYPSLIDYNNLELRVNANDVKVGITQAQADAITTNSGKVGITAQQASDILANNAKVGITTQQASDILANNAKVGITQAQADDILANNAKVGITTQQASDISTNNTFRTDNVYKLNLLDFGGIDAYYDSPDTPGYLPRIVYGSTPLISLVARSATNWNGVRVEEPFSAAKRAEFDDYVWAYGGLEVGNYGDYSNTPNMFRVWGRTGLYGDVFVSNGLTVQDSLHVHQFITCSREIRADGDIIAFSSSDKRLKDNIKPIENTLDKVSKLGGYEFDWNDKQDTYEGHDVGVIAQEVEEVFPELVTTRDNGYKAVKYEKLVAVLISAVNELREEVEQLKSK